MKSDRSSGLLQGSNGSVLASCKYRYFLIKRNPICERKEGAILDIGIYNIIRRKKICSVEKQQQREEKSINQKLMGSEQAAKSYLTTASDGMFENNIVAVTW